MTPQTVEPEDDGRQVPSPPTERVIAVMELLAAEAGRAITLTEIARALHLSRATVHAILASLVAHRWVRRDDRTHGYSWGPAVPALVKAAGGQPFQEALRELHEVTGVQAFVARREAATIAVIDSVGDLITASPARAGFRLPLVAPFGRDFLAWAEDTDRQAWLAGLGTPTNELTQRLSEVLAEVRHRGYVVERLSREYVRVYSALRALSVDGQPDAITARLAGAFADLTLVDFLPGEFSGRKKYPIASVSAPIRDSTGTVVMSVSAAPFCELTATAVAALGEQVKVAAAQIETNLA
ncbi:IclR family transcriptional regulator [Mycobacterium colombiense]|uniref:IclR family transcriptional regulator n=1 Tax=Mycobacterium colombiense TaxID=339268 RepID=A0A1A2YFW3_9MYCO|nr:helix-turn-helix domain-containing protein [Mycobacterium colombiense]OBI37059.1 IclR family transcriptional regulator [Mycobacterium colombiense]